MFVERIGLEAEAGPRWNSHGGSKRSLRTCWKACLYTPSPGPGSWSQPLPGPLSGFSWGLSMRLDMQVQGQELCLSHCCVHHPAAACGVQTGLCSLLLQPACSSRHRLRYVPHSSAIQLMRTESPLSARPHANAGDPEPCPLGAHILFEGFRIQEWTGANSEGDK